MMWGVFRVSTKLVATAVLSIAILILGFVFAPNLLTEFQYFADAIENWLPNSKEWGFKDQAGAAYSTFVNDTVIFGILMSLLARVIVEIVWGLFALAFGSRKRDVDGAPVNTGGGGAFDL